MGRLTETSRHMESMSGQCAGSTGSRPGLSCSDLTGRPEIVKLLKLTFYCRQEISAKHRATSSRCRSISSPPVSVLRAEAEIK